jgi:hypothetical protein
VRPTGDDKQRGEPERRPTEEDKKRGEPERRPTKRGGGRDRSGIRKKQIRKKRWGKREMQRISRRHT